MRSSMLGIDILLGMGLDAQLVLIS
jgi:hypothetical protein